MLNFWIIPADAVKAFRKIQLATIHTQFAKEGAAPKFNANRSNRRYIKSKYGISNLGNSWKQHTNNKTGAAVADIVSHLARAGNDWAAQYGLASRIKALEDQIRNILKLQPDAEGVLVVARYQEWAMRDFNGVKAKSALTAYPVASGNSPGEAVLKWDKQEREVGSISQGAPKGWVVKSLLFWAVPGSPGE